MLSLWPDLFDFALVAPILLRLSLGGILIAAGLKALSKPQGHWPNLNRFLGSGHFVVGGLLIIGLWTQLAALLVALNISFYLFNQLFRGHKTNKPLGYLWLILAVSLSLLFLGPGTLAFDLPL